MDDQCQRPKATKLEWATFILVALICVWTFFDLFQAKQRYDRLRERVEASERERN